MRRNKVDGLNNYPWKSEVNEDDSSVSSSTISGWFSEVYEHDFESSDNEELENNG